MLFFKSILHVYVLSFADTRREMLDVTSPNMKRINTKKTSLLFGVVYNSAHSYIVIRQLLLYRHQWCSNLSLQSSHELSCSLNLTHSISKIFRTKTDRQQQLCVVLSEGSLLISSNHTKYETTFSLVSVLWITDIYIYGYIYPIWLSNILTSICNWLYNTKITFFSYNDWCQLGSHFSRIYEINCLSNTLISLNHVC